jgi:hypothetical protein
MHNSRSNARQSASVQLTRSESTLAFPDASHAPSLSFLSEPYQQHPVPGQTRPGCPCLSSAVLPPEQLFACRDILMEISLVSANPVPDGQADGITSNDSPASFSTGTRTYVLG